MNIYIEPAQERDRPQIMRLLEQANMHYLNTKEMPDLTYENYFLARSEEGIVGFCGYKILSETEAKTELMVVDTKYRGHGIGLKLQTYRMEDMLKKGLHTLTTNTDLPETIKWYKKHFGYKEIGQLKKFHEFSAPDIDYWTTLQVDLIQWDENRRRRKRHGQCI